MTQAPARVPHGASTALLAFRDETWREAARSFFAASGHHQLDGSDPAQALELARLNPVDVALVEAHADFSPLAAELVGRPGLVRRRTCLVFVGPYESLDEYQAFRLGADWVLALADTDKAEPLLQEILARQQRRRDPWIQEGGLVLS